VRVLISAIIWAIGMLYFTSPRIWGYHPVDSLPQPAHLIAYIESGLFGISFGLVTTFRSRAFHNRLLIILISVTASAVAMRVAFHYLRFP
jgi:uncharacterized membrane protein